MEIILDLIYRHLNGAFLWWRHVTFSVHTQRKNVTICKIKFYYLDGISLPLAILDPFLSATCSSVTQNDNMTLFKDII